MKRKKKKWRRKSTMKRRSFEEPFNQHSINNTIINSQNMKLSICSHTHNNLENNIFKAQ